MTASIMLRMTPHCTSASAAAAVLSCLLAVAGCLLWTPTHYETLYGL